MTENQLISDFFTMRNFKPMEARLMVKFFINHGRLHLALCWVFGDRHDNVHDEGEDAKDLPDWKLGDGRQLARGPYV